MSANCDAIVNFPIYGQFGAIRKLNSGRMVCKTYIVISIDLLFYKNSKQNQKIPNSSHTTALNKGSIFDKQC